MNTAPPHDWHPVGPGTPLHIWLETKLEGESGTSLSLCRIMAIGDDPEWIAKDGRTTVTHHSYAPPSHWRWAPVEQKSVRHVRFRVRTVKANTGEQLGDIGRFLTEFYVKSDTLTDKQSEDILRFIQAMRPDLSLTIAPHPDHPPADSITIMLWTTVPTLEAFDKMAAESQRLGEAMGETFAEPLR